MNGPDVSRIPGMIEPVEAQLLFRLASSLPFETGDLVVEFGTFFGRSTRCIAEGLRSNATFSGRGRFHAYDSFECDVDGAFSPYVLEFAKRAQVPDLIRTSDRRIDFLPVFEHFLGDCIADGTVVPVRAELRHSRPVAGAIRLMHIDSPKFYGEFKVILFRFLPRTGTEAVVVFQDFFYHWSATLIAVVALLLERGFLSIVETAASSLACRVVKPVSVADACEIDLSMERGDVPALIDAAIGQCATVTVDRRDLFLPRLVLAKAQWLFEQGRHDEASRTCIDFLSGGGRLNTPLAKDFLEMLGKGFSIRALYAKDHGAS